MLLAITRATGCKKNEETPIIDATTEEAAAIMATSFCTGNAGTLTQVEDAVELSQAVMLKSTLTDSSFTISSAPGALITYQYQVNYSYGFLTPNNYQLAFESTGNYNSPGVAATCEAAGLMNVTGFLSGDSYYVNGQSGRDGTFTMKIGNMNSINGTVTTTLTSFRISKTTGVLESGTATIAVNGNTSAGRSFGFTGTLVYLGNYNASLTIGGKTFYVNVITGVVTK
jgi:hypothetical protein